jgi:hypothetical protein
LTAHRCPCGHPLDEDGDPGEYVCLNGLIYGPCVDEHVCYGGCIDGYGRCTSAEGCCDPEEKLRDLPRRCTSEACDEYDGIHCYGDGCALARKMD